MTRIRHVQQDLFADQPVAVSGYYNASGPAAPVAWYGGKAYYAEWMIDRFPHHRVYIEPFGGAGNVLLRKHPSEVEVFNDLDGRIVHFYKVIRDREAFEKFIRLAELTPYSREQFAELVSEPEPAEPAQRAWWFFVRCRQAIGGLGMSKLVPASWAVSLRTRRKMAEVTSKYLSAIEGLALVAERLRTVVIESLPAARILERYDNEDVFFYCDPPYMPQTRHGGKPSTYKIEMSVEEHEQLLLKLKSVKGKVMLSGYASDLYDSMLADWRREEMQTKAHLANSGQKRTEVIWMNW